MGIEALRGRVPISLGHTHVGGCSTDKAGPAFKLNDRALPLFNCAPGTELGLYSLITFLYPCASLLLLPCARNTATTAPEVHLRPRCRHVELDMNQRVS
jgi:hypothetical protein